MADTVRAIAWGAMKILQTYYQGEDSAQLNIDHRKPDGPVTAADLAANHHILEKLTAAFGTEAFGYLSEETHQGQDPLPQDWVWIIDPLDGTRDFIDRTGEYALHIALAYQQRPVLAFVGVPEANKLYFAAQGQGCFVENGSGGEIRPVSIVAPAPDQALTLVVSRTHRDQRFQNLIDQLPFRDRHYVGSVGCKIVAILEQQADVYISLSGKSAAKDWDFAAPELILTEAGGQFTFFDGQPLRYNRGDVCQWGGILASNSPQHLALCQLATQTLATLPI
ncbi:3'(2'),5'-bisphosphate nucleotidase CysQ [Synechocystis sp. LKSZ1]|uniref:3'(2'),5'-bisphosphate nucleotidase CysQ family protein n=1 Tax=Synechocystis sp. LKSZ1 TaxID=3144951 RepID=UPI00336C0BCB